MHDTSDDSTMPSGSADPPPRPGDFDLVSRGPAHRAVRRLGLAAPGARRRAAAMLLLLLATWVPLALLSWTAGDAVGDRVTVPFFRDPAVQTRFLFVVPVFVLAGPLVAISLRVQVQHLQEAGMVTDEDRPQFDAAIARIVAWRESITVEAVIVALSFLGALVLRLGIGLSEGLSSWERTGTSITLAGWWHTFVSLPILYFIFLRWGWVFVLWSLFLFHVSRLKLQLTPTHPDRTGGLGFLGWGLASFAAVVAGFSATVSAGMVHELMHFGRSPQTIKYLVIAFVVASLILLHAPLLVFSGQLARCRFRGLLDFGALVWRHDRAFDEKWIRRRPDSRDTSLLGSADVQSLAAIAACYEHVDRMWLIPFDIKAFSVLALAALLPMVPLAGTIVPFKKIFTELAGFLI